eukprot:TRINITY_DN94562_c0_g1_i1.p1 TRINITY_DN94562_c0_g1~~TRINITY_DN94562_c0_g1_i1.p1  ORF type:complete len:444 (+),score=95.06 TRINITY_DN94562_c0_g1_i1:81-1412(+)
MKKVAIAALLPLALGVEQSSTALHGTPMYEAYESEPAEASLLSLTAEATTSVMTSQEASVLSAVKQVSAATHDDDPLTATMSLLGVSDMIVAMGMEDNKKQAPKDADTKHFQKSMVGELDKLSDTLPAAQQRNIDALKGFAVNFQACHDELYERQAQVHGLLNAAKNLKKKHEACREKQHGPVSTQEACKNDNADLLRFQTEDTQCDIWPSIEALKPNSVRDICVQSKNGKAEKYEDYLERVKFEFDSELRIYQGLKSQCAGKMFPPPGCNAADTKVFRETAEQCNIEQSTFETAVCDLSVAQQIALERYDRCYKSVKERYDDLALAARQQHKFRMDEWRTVQRINCMTQALTDPNAEAAMAKCKKQSEDLQIPENMKHGTVPDAPARVRVQCMPLHPGIPAFQSVYANISSSTPVTQSGLCEGVHMRTHREQPSDCFPWPRW